MTELTNTSSGTFAMALDPKVIELIDKKTAEDPDITVTLKKTNSGQIAIDFSAEDSDTTDHYRVLTKRTPSGTRLLEVHSSFINLLQTNDSKEQDKENSTSRKDVKKRTNNFKSNKKTYDNGILINELMEIYEANGKVDVEVREENGLVQNINAPLTKTLSGNLAVNVDDIFALKYVLNNAKERAATLTKSDSLSFHLDLNPINKFPNTVIRRTASGEILAVLINSALKLIETPKINLKPAKEELFHIKLKNVDCEQEDLPAVLKSTPSQNYIVVIDKEYEKDYKNTINEVVEDNTECYINLIKSNSGSYLINFDDSDRSFIPNALLRKTSSGNIKVLRNKSTVKSDIRRSSTESGSKVFSELFKRIFSNKKIHRHSCRANRTASVKSISDSNVYKHNKILSLDHQNLLTHPSASLQKTSSGQYAVVLGKESKKSFINNLKNYFKNNSHGLIPVKRTESGEITIVLNDDQKEKTHYGSLKITPSGNIFVMVDEKVIRNSEKDSVRSVDPPEKPSTITKKSVHLIDKIKNPVNKAVTTTCNARPDECSCDVTKCICKEPQYNSIEYRNDGIEKETSLFSPQLRGTDWQKVKPKPNCKICDPDKCTENCCNGNLIDKVKHPIKKAITTTCNADECSCACDITKSICKEQINLKKCRNDCIETERSLSSYQMRGTDRQKVKRNPDYCGYKICDLDKCAEKCCHLIDKVKLPLNKAIGTTCNVDECSCSCDVTKSICKEEINSIKSRDNGIEEKESFFSTQMIGIDWRKVKRNVDGSYKICDPEKCTEKCSINTLLKEENKNKKDRLTHIVIKPSACTRKTVPKKHREEQCFYVVDAVCPYHRDRYDTVSNDLIEISGLCNKKSAERNVKKSRGAINKVKPKILHHDPSSNWDSLHFLPPQLPAFLHEFKYR